MKKALLMIATFGLLSSYSSISFATDSTPSVKPDRERVEFECRFRGCDGKGKENEECWVEGSIKLEERSHKPGTENERREEFIKIKCNDGFTLHSENVASVFEREDLWINASEHGKLASIRIEDLDKDMKSLRNDRNEHVFEADLLTSGFKNINHPSRGECRFKHKEGLN